MNLIFAFAHRAIITSLSKVQEEAKTALRETDRTRAIQILIRKLESNLDSYSFWQTIEDFGEVAKGNKQAIDALIHQLKHNQLEFLHCYIAKSLGKIDPGNKQAIKTLSKLLEPRQDESIRSLAAMYLGEIDCGNEKSLKVLIYLAEHSQDKLIRLRATESVLKITKDNEQAKKELIKNNFNFYESVIDALEIVKDSPQAISGMINIVRSQKLHQFSRWQAALILGEIARNNQQAINALIDLLEHSQDEYTCELAALGLGEIAKDNQQAINTLIDALIKFSKDTYISVAVSSSLEKIAKGNEQAIKTLISCLKNNQDWQVNWHSACILKKILKSSQYVIAVSSLRTCLVEDTHSNNSNLYENCCEVIWYCAQNMPYPEFYQAWHHPPLTLHPEAVETTGVSFTRDSQRLNLAEFPSLLRTAIDSDSELSHEVQLICIDGSKFINPDNPATKIYNEMRRQGCPNSEDSKPKTMAQLQDYWDELNLESDKHLVLVFYRSTPLVREGTAEKVGFSKSFLNDLSKFDGNICVVTEQPDIPLKSFSPSQSNLAEDLVAWMRRVVLES